ncbi:CUE domain-containing protein 1 [Galendromus occidentalis]|uniref:CUE domain-containing protein 1 n=1 Tax=Galendromus occidentalis TaxID=34638 RepID=A0AAJ6QVY1_9ACAR|nr:CUE domain-containing protein 1 [Galendromus occidentalis]
MENREEPAPIANVVDALSGADTTHLEFNQAMKDFQNMFPAMDPDVIEAVLRANNGTVDATIDQLLTMSTDTENEKLRSQLEAQEYQQGGSSSGLACSASSTLPPYSPAKKAGASGSSTKALRDIRNWNPPILGPLPQNFLRLHSSLSSNEATSSGDPELSQFLEDERMAIFLQNEEFMHQLRRNKDFMSSLDGPGSQKADGQEHMQDDAAFREKLKNMGKVSKRKFAQMARIFQRTSAMAGAKSGKHFKHMNLQIPSRDNLLLGEEATSDSEETETAKPKNAL